MSINKPNGDGVDHINIYSQGKTLLGRFLSNWAYSPIDMGEDGKFNSVEGYWYWIGTHDERFRSLSGYAAKQLGREVKRSIFVPDVEFREKIKAAIEQKIDSSSFYDEFRKSTLPFTHYYVYGGVVREAGYGWIVEYIEQLRKELHNDLD